MIQQFIPIQIPVLIHLEMNGYIPQIKITLSKKVTLIKEEVSITLILMPSMRFNRSYNQAFQISISGVINF